MKFSKFFFRNMFYRYPDVVWAQKIWSHPPSSTRNLGTKLAIWHFWQLWNLTFKKLGYLSFSMKHMFFWSFDNVWAHHHLLQLDIWAQKRLSGTFFTSKTIDSKNVILFFFDNVIIYNFGIRTLDNVYHSATINQGIQFSWILSNFFS